MRYSLYIDFTSSRDPEKVREFMVRAAQKAGLQIHFTSIKQKRGGVGGAHARAQSILLSIVSGQAEALTLSEIHALREDEVTLSSTFRTLQRLVDKGELEKMYSNGAVRYSSR